MLKTTALLEILHNKSFVVVVVFLHNMLEKQLVVMEMTHKNVLEKSDEYFNINERLTLSSNLSI